MLWLLRQAVAGRCTKPYTLGMSLEVDEKQRESHINSFPKRKSVYVAIAVSLLIVGGVLTSLGASNDSNNCDFSSSIRQATGSLQLYCLNASKLPRGVTTSLSDASFGNGALLYSVRDGSSTLSVTLQHKPTKDQLANFTVNVIPLHFDVDTTIGKAQIGATKDQTIMSLPTASTTWILVSAPLNYSPDKLTQIAKAFIQD